MEREPDERLGPDKFLPIRSSRQHRMMNSTKDGASEESLLTVKSVRTCTKLWSVTIVNERASLINKRIQESRLTRRSRLGSP